MSIKDNPNFRRFRDTEYWVSIFGEIYHVKKTERKLNPYFKKSAGKSLIKINYKEMIFSRVVWEAFNGPIPKGYSVVRKLSKRDDSLSNLKLMTRQELGKNYGKRSSLTRSYFCKETGKVYKGTRECAKALHISRQTVCDYANGNIKKPMYTIIKLKEKPYGTD